MKRIILTSLVAALMAAAPMGANAQKDKFVPPTMGWASWNTFFLDINEELIRSQADAMVGTGLSKAGYKYVNIDDGYWDGRGDDGHLRLNTKLFPHGMRALTDYIHSLGLKAGIYSDAGDNTCGSRNKYPWGMGVGFYQHVQQDCDLYFNDWNFDYIKVDYCGGRHAKLDEEQSYTEIANAIRNTRHPDAVFNICRWAHPGNWARTVATSWRTTGDIYCAWESVRKIILENLYLSAYSCPGHYNDMDMLEIGRTLSHDEEVTHMVMWCILSSPLIIGCDMTTIPEFSLNLMKNPELIAINQDRLGLSAPVVQRDGEVFVFAKDLKRERGEQRAVAVCNLTDQERTIDVSLAACGYDGTVAVRDAVKRADMGNANGSIKVTIPAHGSHMLVLNGKQRNEPTKYEAEEAYLSQYNEIGKPQRAATYSSCDAASQGAKVTFLGFSPRNDLQWQKVYSKDGGKYRITIKYLSQEKRSLKLAVNGMHQKTFTDLCSGSWSDKVAQCETEVELKPGFNNIRLSNDREWAPDIDCMLLEKI